MKRTSRMRRAWNAFALVWLSLPSPVRLVPAMLVLALAVPLVAMCAGCDHKPTPICKEWAAVPNPNQQGAVAVCVRWGIPKN